MFPLRSQPFFVHLVLSVYLLVFLTVLNHKIVRNWECK